MDGNFCRRRSSMLRTLAGIVLMSLLAAPWTVADCPVHRATEGFGLLDQSPNDVVVHGRYAYTADLYGLTIYDVLDPTAPEKVGELLLPREAYGLDIALVGSTLYAYVADDSSGLIIVNVTDPTAPSEAGRYLPSTSAPDVRDVAVTVSGSTVTAHVVGRWVGLEIVDVTDPANPQRIGYSHDPWTALRLVLEDGYDYVADGSDGLRIIDVSDPANPQLVTTFMPSSGLALDVAVVKGEGSSTAYVAGGTLVAVDVTDPARPRETGSCTLPGSAQAVALSPDGATAYVADDDHGLQIVETGHMTITGSWEGTGKAGSVAVVDTTAYVGDSEEGLFLVDVDLSDPSNPSELGHLETPGHAEQVVVSGDYAYVADGPAGLVIVDVSDADAPVTVGRCDTPGWAYDVALGTTPGGPVAYVADGSQGFTVVDIATPANPVSLGQYTPGGVNPVLGIACVADHVFLARKDDALRIVDVTVSGGNTTFTPRGTCGPAQNGPSQARDVVVYGRYAYVADGPGGLFTIDCNDLDHPVVASVTDANGGWDWALALEPANHRLYVARRRDGLAVMDLTNPAAPSLQGLLTLDGSFDGVAAYRGIVYLLHQPNLMTAAWRLEIVDVTDHPDAPGHLGGIDLLHPSVAAAPDPATGTVWVSGEAILEGVDARCPSCAFLQVTATPDTLQAGSTDTATVNVTVQNLFGDPATGAAVTASANMGSVGTFTDNGDGTYTATYTPGPVSGTDTITVSVEGVACSTTAQVTLTCPSGSPDPPTGLQAVATGSHEVRLTWNDVADEEGYRVRRRGFPLGDVAADTTVFTDDTVGPGTEYCYTVASLDECDGESTSLEACVTTPGASLACLEPAGRDPLGHVNRANLARVVTLGHYAFGADEYGLGVWDIGGSGAPVPVTHWDAPGPVSSVAPGPGSTVVLVRDSWLHVLDVADPSRPRLVASLYLGWAVVAVDVATSADRTTAYLGERSCFAVVNLSDPTNPVLESSVCPMVAWTVAVDGSTAVLGQIQGGASLADVSDPTSPQVVKTFDTIGYVRDVAASGGAAYLVGEDSTGPVLWAVDISDPPNATITGTVSLPDEVYGVTAAEGLAIVTGGFGVCTLSLADPLHPSGPLGCLATPGGGVDAALTGDLALVAEGDFGIQAIGVADPATPVDRGRWVPSGEATEVALEGNLALVADWDGGLRIVDIADPGQPRALAVRSTPGPAADVTVTPDGDTAWVTCMEEGLEAFDLSDPASPALSGTYDSNGFEAWRLRLAGDRGYLAGDWMGFEVLDFTDPLAPQLLGTRAGYVTKDLAVMGNTVLACRANIGLESVDVTDPSNMVVNTRLEGFESASRIETLGHVAFIADRGAGLKTVDITRPEAPAHLGTYTEDWAVTLSADVEGSVAFAGNRNTLWALDVSDPRAITRLDSLTVHGDVTGLAVHDGLLALARNPWLQLVTAACRAPQAGFSWEIWDREVHFADHSLYGATSWSWSFGDGATSTDRNPVHTYAAPGEYTVTLDVTNGFGSDSITQTVTVWIPEDISHDGSAGTPDLLALVAEIFDLDGTVPADAWGSTHRGAAYYDVDGDGTIGCGDLGAVLGASGP